MPAQFPVRASFFMRRDGGARRGLFAGRFVYGMVCLRDCLRGEQFAWRSVYGTDSLRLRNLFKDEVRAGTGEPDRETGKQGNRETGKQGNRETGKRGIGGGSPVGQWSVVGSVGGRFAGRMFPGRGEWPFLRSPKYLRRISCTVRNNPVYLQVRTEEANR